MHTVNVFYVIVKQRKTISSVYMYVQDTVRASAE